MIADALVFLRNRLNQHFKSFSDDPAAGASEDKVVFLDGEQKTDSASFSAWPSRCSGARPGSRR
jgi:hypothetical protein